MKRNDKYYLNLMQIKLIRCITSIMGVEMTLEALIISFKRGTPKVTFILATPAK